MPRDPAVPDVGRDASDADAAAPEAERAARHSTSGIGRRSRRSLVALSVVICLLLGFGVAAIVFRKSPPSNFDGAASVTSFELPAAGAVPDPDRSLAPAIVAEPASARDALEQFLTAEVEQRPDVSFSLLDGATRQRSGTVAAWQSERANRLLPETFSITSERPAAMGVELTIVARRAPAVTPLTGLVPGRSTETWLVVKEDGWRVSSGRPTDVQPELPPDEHAVEIARGWLDAAKSCDAVAMKALQLSPSLLGSPSLGDAVCEAPRSLALGGLLPFAELSNSTVFVSAYGSDVGRWARAVAVGGDVRFTIVLAPLGDEWRVVGVVPSGSPRP